MQPLNKTFILTQFGSPHSWTQEFIDHVQHLEKYGWYWKIFTPNKLESKGNVEIIPMTIEDMNKLMEKKLGINPYNFLDKGVPHKPVSDFYVASGVIFEDYLKGVDLWGITNWDVVYGKLSSFFPDELLLQCDVLSDDVNTINGVFSLFKNNDRINNLFKEIPDWEHRLKLHQLVGTDEYDMTTVVRKAAEENRINFIYPQHYPMLSHDRLEQHLPNVKLSIKEDGSLWELFKDIDGPIWEHARPFSGREIGLFHFIRTKKWPSCLQ